MIKFGEINGHRALWLDNDLLRISILPDKGADIYELVYLPAGVDFLMKTPSGLKPAGRQSGGSYPQGVSPDFLDNYEGGWQELFPNPGDSVMYAWGGALQDDRQVELPFHGETPLLPWQVIAPSGDVDGLEVVLGVDCVKTPFRLERRMRLFQNAAILEIDGKVTNLSDQAQYFQWGHHIVLGGNFLQAGCRLETPASEITTPDVLYEPETALLAPGQSEPWPYGLTRSGGKRADLGDIPGPEARIHDDVYLTGLRAGWVQVSNPNLQLRFRMEWDPSIFGCIVNWRPLGGADLPPLTGIYGLGIEPWTSRFSLSEAIECGAALRLERRQSLETTLRVIVDPIPPIEETGLAGSR